MEEDQDLAHSNNKLFTSIQIKKILTILISLTSILFLTLVFWRWIFPRKASYRYLNIDKYSADKILDKTGRLISFDSFNSNCIL